jgi:small subunit ribosomal protein S3Ae
MAKGKNKKLSKKGKIVKKGDKHPFLKKEWFSVIAPAALRDSKPIGWTCCKKPTGTQIVSDFLKNRVAEMSYADITNSAKDVTKRIKITLDEIQGSSCFTSFHSYELAKERISAMLKKRQTLIEVVTEVKTNDGVVFRIFISAVTNRRGGQVKLNSYAKASKVRALRKRLFVELAKIAAGLNSKNFIHEVVTEAVNNGLEKAAHEVIPNIKLQIGKLKIAKRGNIETGKASDLVIVENPEQKRKENPEAQNLLSKKD